MINEMGSKGIFSENTTHFIDYFKIRLPALKNTTYLIYMYHEKNFWGHQASSDFWKYFQQVENLEKSLVIKEDATTNEIDLIIYNHFSKYGEIQVIVENEAQKLCFQLKPQGFLFDQKLKRISTTDDPFDNAHLVQEGCCII